MATFRPDVVVIGAGLAGAAAATHLHASGLRVSVLESQERVGGRMASTTRARCLFDHGAQFFTTRSPEFSGLVEQAVEAGVVTAWTHGFEDPPDGYPRWRGVNGMGDLVHWLLDTSGVTVRTETHVTDLSDHPARSYLLTAPVPETLALLVNSGQLPEPALHHRLAAVAYKPTIAVLIDLHEPPAGLPGHGGLQFLDHADLAFVTDNQRKGLSGAPGLTVHLSNDASAEMWTHDDAAIVEMALSYIALHMETPRVAASHVHRWRYAGPVEVLPERTLTFGSDPLVALAGEAFGGPKVEGAYLSGRAAAAALVAALG